MKLLLWFCLLLPVSSLALANETILLANFNNKPLNQPIGTGGATVGEPTSVPSAIDAIVRAAPGGGRMLEMFMEQRPSTAAVRFQFLNNQEVSSGELIIRARIRLAAEDEFNNIGLLLREAGTSAQSFMDISLLSANRRLQIRRPGVSMTSFFNVLRLSDANDLEILYNLEEMHLSVCLNGSLLTSELPTLFESKRGIGALLISMLGNAGDTQVSLEDVLVQRRALEPQIPDTVYADRFEVLVPSCPF